MRRGRERLEQTSKVRQRRKIKRHSADSEEDFEWAFGLNRLSLQLMGIWPEELAASVSPVKMSIPRIPFMVLWLVLGLFLPQMYALSQVLRELPLVVDNLTTSCAALTSSIKLILLWNSRYVIASLVDSVKRDYSRAKSRRDRELMLRHARHARIFTISGYAIMFVCFIGFVASPFFGLSIRIINNITDPIQGRFLPLQTYYPYDFDKSPYFEMTYVSQVIAGSFVGISFSVPDNFFGALVLHAGAQCEILAVKFSELLPAEPAQSNACHDQLECTFFRANLRRLIQVHVRLIRFVDDLEKSFNLLILVQVLCLSLIICCLGFGAIKSVSHEGGESPPFVQVATLLGTLLNLMIHMLVYCIASDILTNNSCEFANAVYSSNWYRLPANYSRDIMPVIIRSQNPLRLTAGKFFNLSLNAYLKILKTSAGYISMLLTVAS